ncbi:M23 family metallopeptidase [Deinococcus hopiensis]|uniref:Membrane proteins related to metalloendopeptidases n=1 Tax=Deinococcus hopiensis KR-140 TaxID=695939 RepID=A0A1W1VUV1_9DEIO|nr:M23 family metallopeptidase [Deinococcus hopiensis]SMB97139.1 Membrane proteins related to metalloendopeptidases [Deinococcus hopiensis KR-140]
MNTKTRLLIGTLATSVALSLSASAAVLPVRGDDLAGNERYLTFVHTGGVQAEGKDIGARRYITDTQWSAFKPDATNPKDLNSWVVYGKPFYAMASGTVVACWRNAPENIPGSLHPQYKPGFKFAGGGNHLWILQDDGTYALYAHAQPGSIPANICPHNAPLFTGNSGKGGSPDIEPEARVTNGARISAGQFLGRVGNSGSSESGPHLHVHMEKGGKPVPMAFDRGLTTPFTGGKVSLNGPWTPLAGNALPESSILIWPARPAGNLTFNGIKGEDYQRLAEHLADSGMMPNLITCTSNGATYNSTWVPKQGDFATYHGMTATVAAERHAALTQQGFKRTSSYTCGSVTVAVWRK